MYDFGVVIYKSEDSPNLWVAEIPSIDISCVGETVQIAIDRLMIIITLKTSTVEEAERLLGIKADFYESKYYN